MPNVSDSVELPPVKRLCFFNGVGILLSLSSPLIVERHLQTFTIARLAVWPWTYSGVVSYLLALATAGLVTGATYKFMDRQHAGGRNVWVPPACVGLPIIALSFFFPWGKWPHMGMWLWAVAFYVLSHSFVVCRKARNNSRAETFERLKATITTWQLIVVYSFTAYLAYVISALYIMWLVSEKLVTSDQDRVTLFSSCCFQIAVFSMMIFLGPVGEAWQATFASVDELASYEIGPLSPVLNQIPPNKNDQQPPISPPTQQNASVGDHL